MSATTKQIATITKLLGSREHTDNGKTILVGETRFRTTSDKITTISKAVASRMIDALLRAPEKTIKTTPAEEAEVTAPKFIKSGGEWFVTIPKNDFEEGAELTITKRDGTTTHVRIDDWFEEDGDDYLCGFTTLDAAPVRKATRKATRRRTFHVPECSLCGETEMFDGHRCDECGFTDRHDEPATTTHTEEITMTTIRTEYLPAEPATEDWEPMIREAIATADDPRHALVEHDAITLRLEHCIYAGGTPLWDKPLLGSSAYVEATRADQKTLTIPLYGGHGWDHLAATLDDFMEGWAESVLYTMSVLVDTERRVVALERELDVMKAQRIRQARSAHQLGVTQYKISKAVQRSQPSVQKWLK